MASPVKSCPALYLTVEQDPGVVTAQGFGRALQADPDCSDCENPACVGKDECAIDTTDLVDFTGDQDTSTPASNTTTAGEDAVETPPTGDVTEQNGEQTIGQEASSAAGAMFLETIAAIGSTSFILVMAVML